MGRERGSITTGLRGTPRLQFLSYYLHNIALYIIRYDIVFIHYIIRSLRCTRPVFVTTVAGRPPLRSATKTMALETFDNNTGTVHTHLGILYTHTHVRQRSRFRGKKMLGRSDKRNGPQAAVLKRRDKNT